MKILVGNSKIVTILRKISSQAVEKFGWSDWRKAQNLLDAIAIARDYGDIYTFLSIFFDPIAGHYEKLEENDQQLFMKIHKILDEANTLYVKLPYINTDDYTLEKISEYNTVVSKHTYKMKMQENMDENYVLVKKMSKEERAIIDFIYHCFLVSELEEKLNEAQTVLSLVVTSK